MCKAGQGYALQVRSTTARKCTDLYSSLNLTRRQQKSVSALHHSRHTGKHTSIKGTGRPIACILHSSNCIINRTDTMHAKYIQGHLLVLAVSANATSHRGQQASRNEQGLFLLQPYLACWAPKRAQKLQRAALLGNDIMPGSAADVHPSADCAPASQAQPEGSNDQARPAYSNKPWAITLKAWPLARRPP